MNTGYWSSKTSHRLIAIISIMLMIHTSYTSWNINNLAWAIFECNNNWYIKGTKLSIWIYCFSYFTCCLVNIHGNTSWSCESSNPIVRNFIVWHVCWNCWVNRTSILSWIWTFNIQMWISNVIFFRIFFFCSYINRTCWNINI